MSRHLPFEGRRLKWVQDLVWVHFTDLGSLTGSLTSAHMAVWKGKGNKKK